MPLSPRMAAVKNSKPVWFSPRDGHEDRLVYYFRDALQAGHFDLPLLSPHPLSGTHDEYAGLVFLFREPVDTNGNVARDWYGPKDLFDDVLSVSEVGSGYQSSLLYARGTEPPTQDSRIDVLGRKSISATFSPAWVVDPDSFDPGYDLLELTITGEEVLTGDEVYILVNSSDVIPAGIYTIARHLTDQSVHIVFTYDVSLSLSSFPADAHLACYLLDGYADTESAPGVMADKFHVRRFTYRLATPSISNSWDDSLGLDLFQETLIVPRTWSISWTSGFPSASYAGEESSVGYQSLSKNISSRQKSGVIGNPSEDNIEWPSLLRVRVPTILRSFCIPLAWARAEKGAYLSYDEDWGVATDTWGPGDISCVSRTVRRIVKTGDLVDTLEGQGPLFSFQPKSYSVKIGSWMAHAGDNVWTRARVRPTTIGPFLLKGGEQEAEMPLPPGAIMTTGTGVEVSQVGEPLPYAPGPSDATGAGTGVNVDPAGSIITLTDTGSPPWGSEVLWEIRQSRGRWGYWIVDFTYVTLPADPSHATLLVDPEDDPEDDPS